MKITLIAALAGNRVIGRDGSLPWRFPVDMRHFMRTTMGNPCIMGRRTYESFPKRPLPGRLNIVLTRNIDYTLPDGALRCHDLASALRHCTDIGSERVYICGGASVYRDALPDADEMILTHIPGDYEGDVRFPEWDGQEWQIVGTCEETGLRFSTYQRTHS
ncbi:MAG: dihydrofolate reductase [Candidatus Latescibacterota bacterium]|nr:dihydrofolate reductase [Candidatus Latescibacterota bacterium]